MNRISHPGRQELTGRVSPFQTLQGRNATVENVSGRTGSDWQLAAVTCIAAVYRTNKQLDVIIELQVVDGSSSSTSSSNNTVSSVSNIGDYTHGTAGCWVVDRPVAAAVWVADISGCVWKQTR